jgi:hypothetical protein
MAPKRMFCFDLTDDDRATPAKMIKYAESCPAVKKYNDDVKDDELSMQRKAYMKVVNLLWRNPSLCLANASWLEGRIDRNAAEVDNTIYLEKVSTLKNLDESVLQTWIEKSTKITVAGLALAMKKDPESMLQILYYKLVASGSLVLPSACRSRDVLKQALDQRSHNVGGFRLMQVTDLNLLTASGFIDWGTHGPYTATVVNDQITEIEHRVSSDTAEVELPIVISTSFKMQQGWSDHEACYVFKGVNRLISYNIAEFFSNGQGPHKCANISGKSQSFNDIVAAKEVIFQAGLVHGQNAVAVTTSNFKDEQKKENRRASLSKARTALKAQSEALNNNRSIVIA